MDNLLVISTIISFTLSFFVSIKFNLHMYQLNHYKTDAQTIWLKRNFKKLFINSIPLLIIFTISLFNVSNNVLTLLAIILFLIIVFLNIEKDVKKPIVYTARIKRLVITAFLFTALVLFLVDLFINTTASLVVTMAVILLLAPVLILFFNFVNKPINTAINNWYINDAKKTLKGMPRLMVIGVTGSYGKTSVKTILHHLLSAKYNVLIAPENYNTTLGVVKTIRNNLKATHEIFICEMGADHVGDIKEICDIVKPEHGVITSIGPQHLESFGSIENIIKTKFELADSVSEDGIVFLNYDNDYIVNKEIDKRAVTYGIKDLPIKDYKAYDIKSSAKGLEFKMKDKTGNEFAFNTKLIGKHNIVNIVGSIAVANNLGLSMKELIPRVRTLESVPHRLQLIKKNNTLIIDDAYNSNPVGAKSALETLDTFDGVKILVTPGMIELGLKQYECNYEFGVQASNVCDYIVLVGKEQTKPIYDGILSNNYNASNIFVVDSLKEGLKAIEKINYKDKQKIILLENDLPDNY